MLFNKLFGKKEPGKMSQRVDPNHNPYKEEVLVTIPISLDDRKSILEIKEIKNAHAQVMGAQATLEHQGSKIPILVSSPKANNFSVGINIALHKALMTDFKAELERLRDLGLVSPETKVSYNPDTNNAILFRRSPTKTEGNLQLWKTACSDNMQVLIDDFDACLPFIMGIYGE